eukprot:533608_1
MLLEIVNSYIHIINNHDDNKDFDYIVHYLAKCKNRFQCSMFKRNNRNRSINTRNSNKYFARDINETIAVEILDAIHCYFLHSYDTGNRLTPDEQKQIENIDENDILVSNKIIKMYDILTIKRKKVSSMMQYTRLNRKFNEIENFDKSKYKLDQIYRVGIPFKYGFEDDYIVQEEFDYGEPEYIQEWYNNKIIPVNPKYASLKQESTSNTLAIMTMDQFTSEYKKASIKFESHHCKRRYRPYKYDLFGINKDIEIEHLLSIMIYCNYDNLQYEFSKTYRKNEG